MCVMRSSDPHHPYALTRGRQEGLGWYPSSYLTFPSNFRSILAARERATDSFSASSSLSPSPLFLANTLHSLILVVLNHIFSRWRADFVFLAAWRRLILRHMGAWCASCVSFAISSSSSSFTTRSMRLGAALLSSPRIFPHLFKCVRSNNHLIYMYVSPTPSSRFS